MVVVIVVLVAVSMVSLDESWWVLMSLDLREVVLAIVVLVAAVMVSLDEAW